MPGDAGVGFTDVGFGIPGTHQAKFSPEVMEAWAPNFYSILRSHVQAACASIGCLPLRFGGPTSCFLGTGIQCAPPWGAGQLPCEL